MNGQFERLTPREFQVSTLLAKGLSNKEIAATLSVTNGHVGKVIEVIFSKLDARSRTEVAVGFVRRYDVRSRTTVAPSHHKCRGEKSRVGIDSLPW